MIDKIQDTRPLTPERSDGGRANNKIQGDEDMGEEEKEKTGFFDKKRCKNCEKIENERDEYKAGWQRAVADYQNLQRETERRLGEWTRMSEAQILGEFLPVYDNFKKAFNVEIVVDVEIERWESWRKGIGHIMKQFGDVLKTHGIEEIKTVGEVFDASRHEAVGEDVPAEAQRAKEGEIVREIEGGYTMAGKVLKVAKVIITK